MPLTTLGNLTIDSNRFEVRIADNPIDLTFVEFELLHQLARNAGKVMTRSRLMLAVWHERTNGEDRKLTVHMSRLRKKLRGSEPWQIETVTRRGYALAPRRETSQSRTEDGGDRLAVMRSPERESA